VNNVLSIGQQYLIHRSDDKGKEPAADGKPGDHRNDKDTTPGDRAGKRSRKRRAASPAKETS
jgi:hypothetical protein